MLSGPANAQVTNPARIDMHVTDLSDPRNPKHVMTWNRLSLPPEVLASEYARARGDQLP